MAEENKFKVGDRVYVSNLSRYKSKRGKEGVVLDPRKIPGYGRASIDETVKVLFGEDEHKEWYMNPNELELVEVNRTVYNYEPPKTELKDSGARTEFKSGAVRDRALGKPRMDLIPSWATFAYGWIMDAGAAKYAARNWELGMPMSVYLDCAKRHIDKYIAGFRDEPHLWQAFWNIGCAIHTQVLVYIGVYQSDFYDLPNHIGKDPAPILSEFEKTRIDKFMEESKK